MPVLRAYEPPLLTRPIRCVCGCDSRPEVVVYHRDTGEVLGFACSDSAQRAAAYARRVELDAIARGEAPPAALVASAC
jgi:hypothetical protein